MKTLKTFLISVVWFILFGLIISGIVCGEVKSAPAPMPRHTRERVKVIGNYLMAWGGCHPNYGVTLHADGTYHAVQVSYDGEANIAKGLEWVRDWHGRWSYSRSTNTLTIIEVLDGGNSLIEYKIDMATLRGKTKNNTGVELRRYP